MLDAVLVCAVHHVARCQRWETKTRNFMPDAHHYLSKHAKTVQGGAEHRAQEPADCGADSESGAGEDGARESEKVEGRTGAERTAEQAGEGDVLSSSLPLLRSCSSWCLSTGAPPSKYRPRAERRAEQKVVSCSSCSYSKFYQVPPPPLAGTTHTQRPFASTTPSPAMGESTRLTALQRQVASLENKVQLQTLSQVVQAQNHTRSRSTPRTCILYSLDL